MKTKEREKHLTVQKSVITSGSLDTASLEHYVATKNNLRKQFVIWKDDHDLLSRTGYKTKMSISNQHYWCTVHFLLLLICNF